MNTHLIQSPYSWKYRQSDRALLEFRGADRLEWLQGQATNDLSRLAETPVGFCLCKATGQIEAICETWNIADRTYVSTDLAGRDVLRHRVETMVILEDVTASDLSEEYEAYLLAHEEPHVAEPALAGFRVGTVSEVWLPRDPSDDSGNSEEDEEVLEMLRVLLGVPLRGVDFDEKTLPPEMGPAFEASHVSYSKGCYMGQEVLMRIHSRGHTNKVWTGLASTGPLPAGSPVYDREGNVVGRVTSSTDMGGVGYCATAMLRNDAAQDGTQVTVQESSATVKTLPFEV